MRYTLRVEYGISYRLTLLRAKTVSLPNLKAARWPVIAAVLDLGFDGLIDLYRKEVRGELDAILQHCPTRFLCPP